MKAISLLSSGIDSPVAAYSLSFYIDELVLLHADARPFTDDSEVENFKLIAKHLSLILPCKVRICIVPHGKTLETYTKGLFHPRFLCVFCKRMMVRYAEAYAKGHDGDFIIMGDSLGQVASQTLANILVVDSTVSIPILRPLIGFDKEEIVKIAKKIGTFDISIRKTAGCLAVPNKPATQARVQQLVDIEDQLPINEIVAHAINNICYI